MSILQIPQVPSSIQKGIPLKLILDSDAVNQLAENIYLVHNAFDKNGFINNAMNGIGPLSLTERSVHIVASLKKYLP
ncbi:MAG: hypothetical protein HOK41_06225 [Nitrospina sp.]|jgi:hypothetical protein|nr:hypothetical protein [Nitrospina sp.]